VATKSLDPETKERLCALVQEIVEKDFNGNKTAAAAALGVSQSYVSEIIQRRRGPGTTMLDALATYRKVSIDELLGRAVRREYEPGQSPYLPSTSVGQHRDWRSVREELLRLYGGSIDLEILAHVESAMMGSMPPVLTVGIIRRVYDAIAEVEAEKKRQSG
jgi:transcriptional regulator with XRE-family HTH domain